MNAYAAVKHSDKVEGMLSSADISRIFRRPATWFAKDRVRKHFYALGFPHPVIAGLWSPKAVAEWQATAGANPEKSLPPSKRRRGGRHPGKKQGRANGYAPL